MNIKTIETINRGFCPLPYISNNVFKFSGEKNDEEDELSSSQWSCSSPESETKVDKAVKNFLLGMLEKVDFFVMGDICYMGATAQNNKLKRQNSLPNEIIETDLQNLKLD